VEDRTRPGRIHVRLLPFGPDRVRRVSARADLPGIDLSSRDKIASLNNMKKNSIYLLNIEIGPGKR